MAVGVASEEARTEFIHRLPGSLYAVCLVPPQETRGNVVLGAVKLTGKKN